MPQQPKHNQGQEQKQEKKNELDVQQTQQKEMNQPQREAQQFSQKQPQNEGVEAATSRQPEKMLHPLRGNQDEDSQSQNDPQDDTGMRSTNANRQARSQKDQPSQQNR